MLFSSSDQSIKLDILFNKFLNEKKSVHLFGGVGQKIKPKMKCNVNTNMIFIIFF